MLIVGMYKILFIIEKLLCKIKIITRIYHYYYVDLNKEINVYEYADM